VDATTGERVQAEIFAGILRREIARMKKKIATAEKAWTKRCETGGYVDPPERLALMTGRIEEATKMLKALDNRFLRAP
jgi:hypothetical protein